MDIVSGPSHHPPKNGQTEKLELAESSEELQIPSQQW